MDIAEQRRIVPEDNCIVDTPYLWAASESVIHHVISVKMNQTDGRTEPGFKLFVQRELYGDVSDTKETWE